MKKAIVIIFCIFPLLLSAQTGQKQPMLLGKIVRDSLMQEAYKQWFETVYNDYVIQPDILNSLKKINLKEYSIEIFMATWCDDSHREVPRFLHILDQLGISSDKISIICVNRGENVHKQSPTGEEKGKDIFRVPTFIISKTGKEVNRIVEFPVFSLERDLLSIFSGETYLPNYNSYPIIANWLKTGILSDKNISQSGLAAQLRSKTSGAGEIMAAATVLRYQGKIREAANLCEIAYFLYPDNDFYYHLYAQISLENGDYEGAMYMIKLALAKETDYEKIEKLLETYDKIIQTTSIKNKS